MKMQAVDIHSETYAAVEEMRCDGEYGTMSLNNKVEADGPSMCTAMRHGKNHETCGMSSCQCVTEGWMAAPHRKVLVMNVGYKYKYSFVQAKPFFNVGFVETIAVNEAA